MNHQLVEEELAAPVQSLGRVALRLHAKDGTELEMPAPEEYPAPTIGPGVPSGTPAAIRFESLENRNEVLAEHLFQKLKQDGQIAPADLFGVAHSLWIKEIGRPDTATGRLLARVQSEQDVLSLAKEYISSGAEVFGVIHAVGMLLQHVENLNLDSLIELAKTSYDRQKADVVGVLFEQLNQWMAPRPARAHDLLQVAASADLPATEGLLSLAIGAIFRDSPEEGLSLAVGEIDSPRPTRRRSGRWLLGQFLLKEPAPAVKAEIEARITSGLLSQDTETLEDWIRVAGVVLHASSVFDKSMLRLCEIENDSALAAVARALFLKGKDLAAQGRVSMWLPSLVTYSGQESRSALDLALTNLVEQGIEVEPSIPEFLTAWATRHSGSSPIESGLILSFGQTVRKLAEKPGMFETLITQWLLASDRRLPAALAGVLGEFEADGFKAARLDERVLSRLADSTLMFLGRRLLGYVHSTSHAISMTLSMLQVVEERLGRILPVMRSLIVEELGYDYPGTVIEALESAAKTETRPPALAALEEWQAAIRSRQEAIGQLPRRNELWPPSQLQRQFALARAKQMQKTSEEASDRSVFSHIATRIPLKAGRGFFNHAHGRFNESTQLHTLSYSIEIPRREVLDPVGNAIRGILLRLATDGQK